MNIGVLVAVIGGALGMVCSALTLFIIYRMRRWNTYTKLIVALTSSQLVYDMSVLMIAFHGRTNEFIYIALRSMAGLWAAFITNILSFVVIWTVTTLEPANLSSKLTVILLIIFIPSAAYGILVPYALYNFSDHDFNIVSHVYYWARALSILFNIFSYAGLVYRLYYIQNKAHVGSVLVNPLKALVRRFKYYPIVQVLARFGVAWYEYTYGHDYVYYPYFTLSKTIALFIYVITLPSAGLGYFLVFILVCPGALARLRVDVLSCFAFFGDSHESSTKSTNSFTGFPAVMSAARLKSFGARDSDWTGRDSNMSEIDLVENSLHSATEYEKNSRIARTSTMSDVTIMNYNMWGEDELTYEISRLQSTDRHQISQDL